MRKVKHGTEESMEAISREKGLHVSTRIPLLGTAIKTTMKEIKVFQGLVQGLQLFFN